MAAFSQPTPESILDITQVGLDNFWLLLPKVLQAISEADFVALDLEMTGISTKSHPQPPPGQPVNEQVAVQQGYLAVANAASTYQIYQVGITCARLQQEGQLITGEPRLAYVTETFQFSLTPDFPVRNYFDKMIARTLDRKVAFSLNTLSFHRSNLGRATDVFANGIPYTSRQEAQELRDQLCRQVPLSLKKPKNGGIVLKKQTPEAQAFYNEAREEIVAWNKTGEEYLNIELPDDVRFNKLQIALLNRLVYNDLTLYNLRGRIKENSFYQIERAIDGTEARDYHEDYATRSEAIRRQTGFRIVIDALLAPIEGIQLTDGLDPSLYALMVGYDDPEKADPHDVHVVKQIVKQAQAALVVRKPFLVMHNSLADICFMYSHFIGPLPNDFETFRAQVAAKFGKIVDTKYLATRGHHDMMPDKNLAEMHEELKLGQGPSVHPASVIKRSRYGGQQAVAHEAGYDSYMTTVNFVKLCYHQSGNPDALKHLPREDGPHQVRGQDGRSFSTNQSSVYYDNIIPDWNSEFFAYFANKTRVGTAPGVVSRFYNARK